MAGFANVSITGYLARDPEVRGEVCSFTIPVSKKIKGEERTTWYRVATFGKLAQTCADFLKKGSLVAVAGELEVREYEGKNGKGVSLEVSARDVRFFGGKGEATRPVQETPAAETVREEEDGDELPF